MRQDEGEMLTERELAKLEKRIRQEYGAAQKELADTITQYFADFAVRDEQMKKLIGTEQNGKTWTEADYRQWRLAQIGRGERFQAMQRRIAERYTNARETAESYVNDATPGIYTLNRNYAAYTIEQVAGNVGFDFWDEQTVRRLLVEQPALMPHYPEKRAIKRGIDLAYGQRQIAASVTSGILQGKSLKAMADDLQERIPEMSRNSALRAARTAVTGAQNAGRTDSYAAAEKMGVKTKRQWVATLDNRTRHEHGELDGQVVAVDEPFEVGGYSLMFPGDPAGPPHLIYNCRCRIKAVVEGHEQGGQRRSRDPETGRNVLIENMSYAEWAGWKEKENVVEGDLTFFNSDLLNVAKRITQDIVNDQWQFENFGLRAQKRDTEKIGETIKHKSKNFGGDFEGKENEFEELNGVSTIGINNTDKAPKYGGYEGKVLYLIGGDSAEYGYDPGELIIENPTVLAKMRVQDGKLIISEKIETEITEKAVETAKETILDAEDLSKYAGTAKEVNEYISFKAEMEAKYGADAIWSQMSDEEYDKLERLERIAYKGK